MPSDVGSWFQQGPGNSSSSIGKVSDEPGTQSLSDRITVGNATGALIAASTAVSRTVLITVPTSADTGIHVNAGAAATTSEALIHPGQSVVVTTKQAINAIRGGSADIVVEVWAFEVS